MYFFSIFFILFNEPIQIYKTLNVYFFLFIVLPTVKYLGAFLVFCPRHPYRALFITSGIKKKCVTREMREIFVR